MSEIKLQDLLPSGLRREFEESIGYKFKRAAPLLEALTHRSIRHEIAQQRRRDGGEPPPSNERLEFLGDAVLDLAITAALLEKFPEKSEGELSKLRAGLVQEKTLAKVAQEVGLAEFIFLGTAEAKAGGRKKPSILADAYEALLGAVFLDGGPKKAEEIVLRHFEKRLGTHSLVRRVVDYKTRLQELTQARWKRTPQYHLREATGPDHHKTFQVECALDGRVLGQGKANSMKEAGQKAARAALSFLRSEGAGEPPRPADEPESGQSNG